MKKKTLRINPPRLVFFTIASLLFNISFSQVKMQRQVKAEPATCNVKANNKKYNLKPNQAGQFQRISNIAPLSIMPVEIFYPDGKEGEKVVVSVWDGGLLDNGESVKVVYLDNEKKCVFNFQVTRSLGLFRLLLFKGTDQKVVQFWVGAERKPVKQ